MAGTGELQAVVCDVCQTFVATAKKGAPQDKLELAFRVAINAHLLAFHPKSIDETTFSYGMRTID